MGRTKDRNPIWGGRRFPIPSSSSPAFFLCPISLSFNFCRRVSTQSVRCCDSISSGIWAGLSRNGIWDIFVTTKTMAAKSVCSHSLLVSTQALVILCKIEHFTHNYGVFIKCVFLQLFRRFCTLCVSTTLCSTIWQNQHVISSYAVVSSQNKSSAERFLMPQFWPAFSCHIGEIAESHLDQWRRGLVACAGFTRGCLRL